ncbi:MAG TPA: Asp-tRNA(Asn)/Glu-tRNA(Gln) amidotransferase subunit GatB [Papillibacter sp.]|jgi:aspartyl-tRNA(Asn)/glutamyl-tRNA(Gln) amidotransferase subunit B|nr:Asp-tRNA(Asn)/Glu-tRNA(Gln) amidotransferase subunit GatB [Papillibacter sp.]
MFEMVIGLETHVELSTKTKIFCSCTTQFGGEPNTHCCPICTGQPGTLPVLNKKAVEYAITAGLALGCRINRHSVMARKHYVYPDLSKAYQISQYELPLCEGGKVTLSNGREIRITRIHIEEDAGKLVHQGNMALIDYNRGGVPLIEIVTEPDFRSAEEATEYLEKLQTILRAVKVSDCRMQEGSMRCDVNLSVRRKGETAFGIRSEVKNLNSFTSVAQAIGYEFERHVDILQAGGTVEQETRHFNAEDGTTTSLRDKENADDYRYFPDPDIIEILVPEEVLHRLEAELPELPDAKFDRYVKELGIPEDDAKMLTKYRPVSEYFERASEGVTQPKTVASFIITQMFAQIQTEAEREHWNPDTTAEQLRELVRLLESGKISRNVAKRVFTSMLETGKGAHDFLSEDDLAGFDPSQLTSLCQKAIDENPKTVSDYKNGKEKAIKALVGAVMRATKGRADALAAEAELKRLIDQ